ncbi:MAG: VKORC1/thioredoxin domain protein [Parcubacteria group bacterium GW2011_GWA2_47_16]|nr:MAG: VKORC1/thioredoxin domain protein [Parcubacteria group bacterium GW2011_GWA2_47_16]
MKKILILVGIVGIIVFVTYGVFSIGPKPPEANALDGFAQCLASKDITMYGAEWCSHCKNEKKAFGDSFRFVPYIECPDNPQKCLAEGVKGYPTWIWPDGKKFEGEQGLQKLSQEGGCPLYPSSGAPAVLPNDKE